MPADNSYSEDYELLIRQGPERARVAGVKEKGKSGHFISTFPTADALPI